VHKVWTLRAETACHPGFGHFCRVRDTSNLTRCPRPVENEAELTATPTVERLRSAGLRPTRQRVLLAELLFGKGDRHVSAEMLHGEVLDVGEQVSLATVYNTLHQFTDAGLLRELAIDGSKAFFDTNVSNHNHFFIEDRGELIDIHGENIRVDGLPQPPEGMRISHIDVVVRLVPDKKR
jgi:Fur family transcriptional regulator, iron response regulator